MSNRLPPFEPTRVPDLPEDWQTTDLFDRRVHISDWEALARKMGFSLAVEHEGVSLEDRLNKTRFSSTGGQELLKEKSPGRRIAVRESTPILSAIGFTPAESYG